MNGTTLTLTFDEALDTDSAPAGTAFDVSATQQGGSTTTTSGTSAAVTIDGATVTLTLASAVSYPDTGVKVSYTKPASNPLQDTAVTANAVAAFTDEPVTNNTPGGAAPVPVDFTASPLVAPPGDPVSRLLIATPSDPGVFTDSDDDSSSVTVTAGPTVQSGSRSDVFHTLSVNGGRLSIQAKSEAALNALRPKLPNPVVTEIGLTIRDSGRNPATAIVRCTTAWTDTTAPAFSSARVDGTTLILTFDEPLAAAASLANDAFAVRKTPAGDREQMVDLNGSPALDGSTLTLTLASAVLDRDTGVKVSYARPATGSANRLQDEAANEVASFTDEPVANARDTTAPTFQSAAVSADRRKLVITFSELLDESSVPSIYRLLYRPHPGSSAGAFSSIAIDGDTVMLSRWFALREHERSPTVSYRSDGKLRDWSGNAVASFTDKPVSNGGNTPRPPSPPSPPPSPPPSLFEHAVPMLPSASHPQRQGFVRLINRSGEGGEVSIVAFDDAGTEYGPLTLAIGANEAVQFSAADLEAGNAEQGLKGSTGEGEGAWRLELESPLELVVLSYVRTPGGPLASLHDVAPEDEAGHHRVVFFNPASNRAHVSRLRLINPGEEEAEVRITGIDAAGEAGEGTVVLTLGAQASRSLSAQALETGEGEGIAGALGDGAGKWRLRVTAERPIRVMSLLASPDGALTNVSTAPERAVHRVPLLPAASHPQRRGFVRLINRSGEGGEVSIVAFDNAGVAYGPLTLAIGANEAVQFRRRRPRGGQRRAGA